MRWRTAYGRETLLATGRESLHTLAALKLYLVSFNLRKLLMMNDDDDVITLAQFPKMLAVVIKQAVTRMHLDGRKQTSAK